MTVTIILFGQLVEITGSKQLTVPGVDNTDQLIQYLHKTFPGLVESKYIVAVEKNIISGNTILKNKDTVALLPPYAGG